MSKFRKIVTLVVAVAVATAGYIVWDWYKFATTSEIDPQRGIYANDHLEVWIDINARMPQSARLWACKTLLDRQAKVMGGGGAMPPYSCQEGFDPDAEALNILDTIISANTQQSVALAQAGTDAQKAAITECIKTELVAGLTPQQLEEAKGNEPSQDTSKIVILKGAEVSAACRAKSGF